MRSVYSFLLYLLMPLVLLYLLLRGLRSREYLSRWSERFGYFDPPAEDGGIWVHAVSMGEVNAASTLIQGLQKQYPDAPLYITTFTPTGSSRVRELFGDTVFHVYSPFDLPGSVSRFFERLRPALAIILETEIWPNLFRAAASRSVPSVIVNARISDRSFGSYRRFRKLTSMALGQVSRIAAQSATDAKRLLEIGAPESILAVTGNLKFDVSLPPSLLEQGESIRLAWGANRPVLVAGSTHENDEIPVLKAFAHLLDEFPDALLVLVPRHPERFGRAAALARAAGLRVSLRSENASCGPDMQCFVIDAMGELLPYYAACDIAFVGGSLEPIGGHNVLEPAALCKPVLVGPHTFNFADITQQLTEAKAAIQVQDGVELERALRRLFAEPETRDRMGRAGSELVRNGQGAVKRTLAIIDEVFIREAG
ncbi:MAG: lipid IV(A) 3-deoxy-D-manno-octulosonic acid transferase [Xanthomonadales bacterium]|jgi:3-deoxy-D-manno-octulosonic-acid transferase|nr:lipid IV(A) 3-deoxy-D-manno-octulosonic acid transferase [Xanthomonadales bacterium]